MSFEKLLVIRLVSSTAPGMTGPQPRRQHLAWGSPVLTLGFWDFLSPYLWALPQPALILILLAIFPCTGQPGSHTSHFCTLAWSPVCMAFALLSFSLGDSWAQSEGHSTEWEANGPGFKSCFFPLRLWPQGSDPLPL